MEQKKQKLMMIIAAAVLAVVGIILFIFGIVYGGGLFVRISAIVTAVICLVLAGELVYILFFMNGEEPNFFLYDSKTRRNIPVQKLTLQNIHVKMNRYFAGFAPSEGKIWTDGILTSPTLEMAEEFKPIVGYKLLLDLAEKDVENGWKCFELASEETVEFICMAIEGNGDGELASNIMKMKQLRPYNGTYIRDYLIRNRKYLQSRMFKYVYENIDKF